MWPHEATFVGMRAVAIRELKNRLSAYLREVAAGEIVLVTDRGRVIAELRQPTSELMRSSTELSLERLADAGVLILGLPQDPKAYRRPKVRMQRSSQELLDEERGER
jgi:antitoxin (DNA-binding transcriptional repressor) of toxin-antitoxin stability system